MESKHPGGEQFLLRIFVVGLNYFYSIYDHT